MGRPGLDTLPEPEAEPVQQGGRLAGQDSPPEAVGGRQRVRLFLVGRDLQKNLAVSRTGVPGLDSITTPTPITLRSIVLLLECN